MTTYSLRTLARFGLAASALALLAACDEPLDLDMRGKLGAFSTSPAAQTATAERPKPDARGVITYPNYQVAVARRGDTVASVAARTGLNPQELARYNGLENGQALREGEVVALPTRIAAAPGAGNVDITAIASGAIDASPDTTPAPSSVQTTALPPAASAPKPAAAVAGAEPVKHRVVRGETAYTVARLYNVPVKSLGEWNGLGPDFAIREGQHLLIPVAGATAPKPLPTAVTAAVTEPGEGSPTPTPPSATKPLPEQKVAAQAPDLPKVSVGQPSKPAVSTAPMGYPVQGKIIRAFSKGKNDGIDIAAAPGTPVKAAADGSVAAITASADKVPIVVVRHPDNLLTVYANIDDIQVKKGDPVKRGQSLAKLRAGDNAYVHFEVRNGFDSVNPAPYLD